MKKAVVALLLVSVLVNGFLIGSAKKQNENYIRRWLLKRNQKSILSLNVHFVSVVEYVYLVRTFG